MPNFLILHFDLDFIAASIYTDQRKCHPIKRGQQDFFWLKFYTDRTSQNVSYGEEFKSSCDEQKLDFHGRFFHGVKNNLKASIRDNQRPYLDLLSESGLLNDIRKGFQTITETEENTIQTFISYSISIDKIARDYTSDYLNRNGLNVLDDTLHLPELAAYYIAEKSNLPFRHGQSIIVMKATNLDLHLFKISIGDNILLADSNAIKTEKGSGFDHRKRAIANYILNYLQKHKGIALTSDEQEDELKCLNNKADIWLKGLEDTPVNRPYMVKSAYLTKAPNMKADILLKKSDVDADTSFFVSELTQIYRHYLEDLQLDRSKISAVVLLGDMFNNLLIKSKFQTVVDSNQLIILNKKDITDIISYYPMAHETNMTFEKDDVSSAKSNKRQPAQKSFEDIQVGKKHKNKVKDEIKVVDSDTNPLTIGIDLGTTYCCVAYINSNGEPDVIPSTDRDSITPSVIYLHENMANVGKKANDRKIAPGAPIYEFIKRDIGKPQGDFDRYVIDGFYFGAVGMSAIILAKLKKEAFKFFRRKNMISRDTDEKLLNIPAVITVPAYFGDLQRQETRQAGEAAGLDVLAIINEPTAAALAYGRTLEGSKRFLVFDLGGGTFDVTILKVQDGESVVMASEGADQLGGKDWDSVILEYLYTEYNRLTCKDIPEDLTWEMQSYALQAKFELTEQEVAYVDITCEGESVEIPLYRSIEECPEAQEHENPFFFEQRSDFLLDKIEIILTNPLEKTGLSWAEIDDIIMVGGSCRMPMIPKLIERLSGHVVERNIPRFSYDTAIAMGAVVYGHNKSKVQDVTSRSIGIEVEENGRKYVEHLIYKNAPLPTKASQKFHAEKNAILHVYEGESRQLDECKLRGTLELENPEADVTVFMNIDFNGVLTCLVEIPPDTKKVIRIRTKDESSDIQQLKEKIAAIDIRI